MSQPLSRWVRKAIGEIVEPELRRMGFSGDYPEYARFADGMYHGLAIRFDRNGGGFWFDLARAGKNELREGEPEVHLFDRKNRGAVWHVVRTTGPAAKEVTEWHDRFSYAGLESEANVRALVSDAAEALGQADIWFRTGKQGDAIEADFSGPPGRPKTEGRITPGFFVRLLRNLVFGRPG